MDQTAERDRTGTASRVRTAIAVASIIGTVACSDSPLELAIKESDVDKVRIELAAAAASKRGLSSFAFEFALWQLAPDKPQTTEILKMLLASLPAPDRVALVHAAVATNRGTKGRVYYCSPVEVAARRWSPDGVRVLMDNGLIVKSTAVQGALVDAAANGCDPIITMLLDAGAAVNGRNSHNDSALAMARRVNNQATVALLLARGARDN